MAKKYKGFKGSGMSDRHITQREKNELANEMSKMTYEEIITIMAKCRGVRKKKV